MLEAPPPEIKKLMVQLWLLELGNIPATLTQLQLLKREHTRLSDYELLILGMREEGYIILTYNVDANLYTLTDRAIDLLQ